MARRPANPITLCDGHGVDFMTVAGQDPADEGRTELDADVQIAPVVNGDGSQNGLAKSTPVQPACSPCHLKASQLNIRPIRLAPGA